MRASIVRSSRPSPETRVQVSMTMPSSRITSTSSARLADSLILPTLWLLLPHPGGQPAARLVHLPRAEGVAIGLPAQRHVGTGLPQQRGQALRLGRAHERVGPPTGQEDGDAHESRGLLWLQRDLRMEQSGAGEHAGVREEQARRDIGPIRITNRDDAVCVETVCSAGTGHEVGQLVRAEAQTVQVEDAPSEMAEET